MKNLILVVLALVLSVPVLADTVIITNTKTIAATPTLSLTAYASGDLVGGKLTILEASRPARNSGMIVSVEITDAANQGQPLEVVFFDQNPTATTFTDNAAFAIAAADLPKVIGSALVSTISAFSGSSAAQARNLTIPFYKVTNKTIYAAIVSRGTPTYTASALTVKIGILQD